MSGKTKFIILTLSLLIIAAPLSAWAAYSLVPCGLSQDYSDCVNNKCPDGTACTADGMCINQGGVNEKDPCSLCHLYILIQRILGFIMWTIAPIVAVLAIGIAGFKIMISGEKPGLRADGFKIIQKTVIGLAIMFAGWVLINEALLFFTGKDNTGTAKISFIQSPWNQVTCVPPKYIEPK